MSSHWLLVNIMMDFTIFGRKIKMTQLLLISLFQILHRPMCLSDASFLHRWPNSSLHCLLDDWSQHFRFTGISTNFENTVNRENEFQILLATLISLLASQSASALGVAMSCIFPTAQVTYFQEINENV